MGICNCSINKGRKDRNCIHNFIPSSDGWEASVLILPKGWVWTLDNQNNLRQHFTSLINFSRCKRHCHTCAFNGGLAIRLTRQPVIYINSTSVAARKTKRTETRAGTLIKMSYNFYSFKTTRKYN